MDLEAIKWYLTFPKVSRLDPDYLMQFCVIYRRYVGEEYFSTEMESAYFKVADDAVGD